MKLSTLMTIKAAVCLVFGIMLLFVPSFLMSILGVKLDAGGELMARLYAASLFGNLILTRQARKDTGSLTLRASILGLFVYDAIGLIVALIAVVAGVMNVLGWAIVAVYLLLTIGFGYFQFLKPSHA
jgi:hypothetical protein